MAEQVITGDLNVTGEISQNGNLITPPLIPIMWAELKALRDERNLIPGQQYLITDYVTTTSQPGTTSARHRFQLLVQATDRDVIDENAKAVAYVSRSNTYWANIPVNAWQIKYCLDNDFARFGWADVIGIIIDGDIYYRNPENDDPSAEHYEYAWTHRVYEWGQRTVYTDTEAPTVETIAYESTSGGQEYTIDDIHPEGKGVIYWMQDENGNEASYDFKNIMFQRQLDSNHNIVFDRTGTDTWCYTFSWLDENDTMHDATHLPNLNSDEGIYGVHDNIIGNCAAMSPCNISSVGNSKQQIRYILNYNVFYACAALTEGYFFGFVSNCIQQNSSHCTFINMTHYNTVGIESYRICCDHCYNNTLMGDNYDITLKSADHNIIGSHSSHIELTDACYNRIGENCTNLELPTRFDYNIIDNNVKNTLFARSADLTQTIQNVHIHAGISVLSFGVYNSNYPIDYVSSDAQTITL